MTAHLPRMVAPRIVYAGTPDFAVPALRQLLHMGAEVVGVYDCVLQAVYEPVCGVPQLHRLLLLLENRQR